MISTLLHLPLITDLITSIFGCLHHVVSIFTVPLPCDMEICFAKPIFYPVFFPHIHRASKSTDCPFNGGWCPTHTQLKPKRFSFTSILLHPPALTWNLNRKQSHQCGSLKNTFFFSFPKALSLPGLCKASFMYSGQKGPQNSRAFQKQLMSL